LRPAGVSSTQDAKSPAAHPVTQIERVTGIGGVFLKVSDPKGLAAWYKGKAGIETKGGFHKFEWREKDKPDTLGQTVWTLFPNQHLVFWRVKIARDDQLSRGKHGPDAGAMGKAGVKPEKVEDSPMAALLG
jgi:hypothetical protein